MRTAIAAIELRGFRLAHRRGGRDDVVLEGVDLEVPHGGFHLIVGDSGSGKSTFLHFIAGLWEPQEPAPRYQGQVEVLGVRIRGRYPRALRRRVAAVLQDEGLLDELTPRQNVALALRAARRSPKLARGLLSQAGLDSPPSHVASLSGGMRKRVAVARALALDPDLIVYDEPTAGLDREAAREIAKLLRETHERSQRPRTTIVITHDLEAFEGLAEGVLEFVWAARTVRFCDDTAAARSALAEWERTEGARSAAEWDPGGKRRAGDDPALERARGLLLGTGSLALTLRDAIIRLPPVQLGVVVRTIARYATEPVVFTCMVAVTIGFLATFFALQNNPLESAFTGQLLTGVGKVLTAVLVPLLAGFFFTARMAAGAAARIGTMKRTQQVAALQLMGIRPVDYLLTPLVWAMCVAMPLITLACTVAAAMSSFAAYRLLTGASAYAWATSFFRTVDRADLRFLTLKALLSGFFIAVLTYHLAVGPKQSGSDVGTAVNSSIVLGMITVLIVHSTFTLVQFA